MARAPVIRTIENPTDEELAMAEQARSPMEFVSEEDRQRYRGKMIAVLSDNPGKGTVIAHADRNDDHPETYRRDIARQVSESAHKGRAYQIRQDLALDPD